MAEKNLSKMISEMHERMRDEAFSQVKNMAYILKYENCRPMQPLIQKEARVQFLNPLKNTLTSIILQLGIVLSVILNNLFQLYPS
jgi:hypothetical protein